MYQRKKGKALTKAWKKVDLHAPAKSVLLFVTNRMFGPHDLVLRVYEQRVMVIPFGHAGSENPERIEGISGIRIVATEKPIVSLQSVEEHRDDSGGDEGEGRGEGAGNSGVQRGEREEVSSEESAYFDMSIENVKELTAIAAQMAGAAREGEVSDEQNAYVDAVIEALQKLDQLDLAGHYTTIISCFTVEEVKALAKVGLGESEEESGGREGGREKRERQTET